MAAERTRLIIYSTDEKPWSYPDAVVKLLKLPAKQWQIRKPAKADE
jgi:hypothetical protein